MLDFQHYQTAFTAHIRDPKTNKKPTGVDPQRMAAYRDAVFNNITECVSVCFPVCQTVIGKRAWRQLLRQFMAQHAADTPIFREIPESYLCFLNGLDLIANQLPAFLPQLAHYEWAELAVSHLPEKHVLLSQHTNLLDEIPILTSAHLLLEYDYAVHKISKQNQAQDKIKTHILIFRNKTFNVKFTEINSITYQLLLLIKQNQLSGSQALCSIAEALNHPQPELIVSFGGQILQALLAMEAILGTSN